MNKKMKLLAIVLVLAAVILNILIIGRKESVNPTLCLSFSATSDVADAVQVFAAVDKAHISEENSSLVGMPADKVSSKEAEEMKFQVAADTGVVRIDLGSQPGTWTLSDVSFTDNKIVEKADAAALADPIRMTDVASYEADGETIHIVTDGDDPQIFLALSSNEAAPAAVAKADRNNLLIRILALLLIDGAAAAALIFRNKVLALPVELIENRGLILNLAKNDFKTKYAGSYLGIFWAFVQPVVTILVYWFVFSVGFRSGGVSNVPFVVYLVSGLVPWFFIQEFMISGTNALIEYSYLVKKVVFKISVLPMVKAISAFFVHAFFIAITFLICLLYGINPGIQAIQIIYYFFAMFVLGLGVVYGTCAIVIFFRDLSQIINIILQVGVWTIPIMWQIGQIDPKYHWVFKLNPMYYIVNGYRESFYGHTWFFDHMGLTVYFWAVTLLLFLVGTVIFKRLKIHFADVL